MDRLTIIEAAHLRESMEERYVKLFDTKRKAQYFIRTRVNGYWNARPVPAGAQWAVECTGGRFVRNNGLVF